MTLRIVPTPFDASLSALEPRTGGFPAELLDACVARPDLEMPLRKLRAADVLVVTTGQQPALFTGPMYTVYKALSAAAIAARLEREWGRPVVPIFWSAGDDHDFVEASHASWLAADGSLRTATLPARAADAPLTPLYRQPLGTGVVDALARLADELPPSEFRERTVAWLAEHFHPDATLAAASLGALATLLAPAGVVCFDSTHGAAKRAAAPHLLRAIDLTRQLNDDLAERSAALAAEGAEDAGVAVGDGATLVMLEGRQGRDRLIASGDGVVTRRSGERFDAAALRRIAAEEPERLSANVLLRPVVESAILPTVAYVGGPGELRYLRLTPPIYERMNVPRQQPVPRWSGMLVERRVDRVLEKFDIALDELLDRSGALEERLVRSQLPDEAVRTLAELRAALDSGYAVLEEAAATIDPTLRKPLVNLRTQALNGTQDAERKMVQHLKRRQETELGQLGRARDSLLPAGKPQERILTAASFLARYGESLLPEIEESIADWYGDALEGQLVPA